MNRFKSPHFARPASSAGFTLVELMVVVAVIAIISAAAGPSFRTLMATQRIKSAASAVTESLWMARSEALKRNAVVSFTVDNAALAAGWQIKDGATILHNQDGFSRVAIASGGGTYTFNPYGRLTAGAGDLGLVNTEGSVQRCIAVSTSGRATVRSGTC